MIERGFWRHTGSGQIWAVETEHDRPVRCAGPLDFLDLAQQLLPYLDYSTAYIGHLRAEWQAFVVQQLCAVCGTAFRAGRAASPDGRAHLSCSV
jgi:hypothetical protein